MRSWLARRTRNALTESLKKKGFDSDGRRLPGSGNQTDLYGTAFLGVRRLAKKIPYIELIQQTDLAVSAIQEIHDRGGGKNRGNGQTKGAKGHGIGRERKGATLTIRRV